MVCVQSSLSKEASVHSQAFWALRHFKVPVGLTWLN